MFNTFYFFFLNILYDLPEDLVSISSTEYTTFLIFEFIILFVQGLVLP